MTFFKHKRNQVTINDTTFPLETILKLDSTYSLPKGGTECISTSVGYRFVVGGKEVYKKEWDKAKFLIDNYNNLLMLEEQEKRKKEKRIC